MQRSNNPLIISPEAEDDSVNLSLFYGTVKDGNGYEVIDLDRVNHFLALLHETHCDIRDYPEHNSFYENPFRRRLFFE